MTGAHERHYLTILLCKQKDRVNAAKKENFRAKIICLSISFCWIQDTFFPSVQNNLTTPEREHTWYRFSVSVFTPSLLFHLDKDAAVASFQRRWCLQDIRYDPSLNRTLANHPWPLSLKVLCLLGRVIKSKPSSFFEGVGSQITSVLLALSSILLWRYIYISPFYYFFKRNLTTEYILSKQPVRCVLYLNNLSRHHRRGFKKPPS